MDTTLRLSENTRQGFEGLKAAFCLGSMEAKSNVASGLRLRLRRKCVRTRCTGKKRDNETGLDYFGARYMSAPMGWFMSPDPLLNSGRPDNPQSWNRYAYVGNNPLRFTDPTGLYEWDASLGGDCTDKDLKNGKCDGFTKKQGKEIIDLRKDIRTELKNLGNAKSEEILLASANAIGKENVVNGVTIGIGTQEGMGAQVTVNRPLSTDANGNPLIVLTLKAGIKGHQLFINLAHEGKHISDVQSVVSGAQSSIRHLETEINAYKASIVAANYLGYTVFGVGNQIFWNKSWSQVDQQARPTFEIIKFLTNSPGYKSKLLNPAYEK